MKKSIIISFLLVLLSISAFIGTRSALLPAANQITITEHTVSGDPKAAEGLLISQQTAFGNPWLWTTTFTTGQEDQAQTGGTFYPAGWSSDPSFTASYQSSLASPIFPGDHGYPDKASLDSDWNQGIQVHLDTELMSLRLVGAKNITKGLNKLTESDRNYLEELIANTSAGEISESRQPLTDFFSWMPLQFHNYYEQVTLYTTDEEALVLSQQLRLIPEDSKRMLCITIEKDKKGQVTEINRNVTTFYDGEEEGNTDGGIPRWNYIRFLTKSLLTDEGIYLMIQDSDCAYYDFFSTPEERNHPEDHRFTNGGVYYLPFTADSLQKSAKVVDISGVRRLCTLNFTDQLGINLLYTADGKGIVLQGCDQYTSFSVQLTPDTTPDQFEQAREILRRLCVAQCKQALRDAVFSFYTDSYMGVVFNDWSFALFEKNNDSHIKQLPTKKDFSPKTTKQLPTEKDSSLKTTEQLLTEKDFSLKITGQLPYKELTEDDEERIANLDYETAMTDSDWLQHRFLEFSANILTMDYDGNRLAIALEPRFHFKTGIYLAIYDTAGLQYLGYYENSRFRDPGLTESEPFYLYGLVLKNPLKIQWKED